MDAYGSISLRRRVRDADTCPQVALVPIGCWNQVLGRQMKQTIRTIDFASIPKDLEGLWVILRLGPEQEIMGQGESPQEAIRQSRIDPADPRFALTQVPETPTAAWMDRSAG